MMHFSVSAGRHPSSDASDSIVGVSGVSSTSRGRSEESFAGSGALGVAASTSAR
jgi:hypothetical protein